MFDGESFGQQMVSIVRDYMAAELEPLRAQNMALAETNAALIDRVAALEARELVLPAELIVEPIEVITEDAVKEFISAAIAALPDPEPGAPGVVDMDAVAELVGKAVSELPPPKDGVSVDIAAVDRMLSERVERAISALPAPKDGVGLADALKDQDGCLILVMTDGSTKNLGVIDGKDGHTFTLDDFEIVPMDERTIKMGFTYGEVMHSFELALPIVIYRGVWREDETYQRGDMATWAGSVWHCDNDNCTSKPDSGNWTLAVKRGRDAK